MVDVGDKPATLRRAIAQGRIRMHADTLRLIIDGNHKKGDVLGVARIAGIMAAKKTHELIPLCHPLPISKIAIDFEEQKEDPGIQVTASVLVDGKTGVEMEALTGATVAALTVYDMCKAINPAIVISDVRLHTKTGGKSDYSAKS